MADGWQYVAVRRDVEEGSWIVRGPAQVQVPAEEDPLVLLNVAGQQGWELVDRQVLKDFRGGPSMEFLFKRRVRLGPPAPAAPTAAPEPEGSTGDDPFPVG